MIDHAASWGAALAECWWAVFTGMLKSVHKEVGIW